ncbi:lipopolysaccharide biosynthesis protein [Anaeromicropila herbilytica]|uniref:Polysaccharide biosynthesis protein n=1 Tax=Anaeromicropila herbilytica TaxID=2785025 RepID=A0A7R7ENS5_9FIRM|nr:oligosaccharide flippase family protein [Anaeromicropila herbilytica]BCN32280.1 polysaccharide biosynthesis protein [Anaeromicropila herbilytica]
MSASKGKKASILYLFATLFNKGIAFLTVPIFTRLLSTNDYGIVTTFNSWVDILTVVLSLALYMSIRTAFVDFKSDKKEFLNTVITFTLIISVGVGILTFFFSKLITGLGSVIVLFAVLQGAASALMMDYQQYLMMDLRYIQRSIYMALPNFLAVIFSVAFIYYLDLDNMYFCRIIPTMVVYLIFGLIIITKTYAKQRPSINKKYLKYGLGISLPLVLHGIALNILSQADRTMITVLANASQTGIYSLVYNFGMISAVLTTALDGVWLPWFMIKIKEKNTQEINKCASDYIKLMTCAMVGLILLGPELLKFLAAPIYWEGISIIPPIVLANYFIFMYTFYVNVEHFHKRTMGITFYTIIAAAVNIILNYIFIPKFGYIAAAYITLISYMLAMALHARRSKKLEEGLFPFIIFAGPLAIILISTTFYYLFLEEWILRWILMIIIVGAIALIERRTIKFYLGGSKG